MMVTDIVKELAICDESGEWQEPEVPDLKKAIAQYNANKQRFLYYPWGVFVTSYARRNLYTGILEFKDDYIYSDTDSIKCLNMDRHMDYVNGYNRYIVAAIDRCLKSYGLDPDLSRPKNIKGSVKQIGVWDWETEKDPYTEFKTLGAKRYMYMQGDRLHITIAGVSKQLGGDFIAGKSDPFRFFDDGMVIDREHSGKLTHSYLDYEQKGTLTDYRGMTMDYAELSSVHLEQSEYKMSMLEQFKDFCNMVKESVIKC